jgi:PPK2 family polyphosphate:nucleotide phosphotransferase
MEPIDLSSLRVAAGSEPELGRRESTHAKLGMEKEAGKARLGFLQERLATIQESLWAEGRRALLLVLQGMDTSGKSGTIGRVFRLVNPEGVKVASFGVPTEHELAHDYLWRVHAKVPPRGTIGVFDRSHYEDVGVVRVEGLVDDDTAARRFRHIRDFEAMLVDNGTMIRKVWLDISPEEQREELQERIDEPDKHWKFSMGDLDVREKWHHYMRVYREAMAATSTDDAPWYVVPADRRWVSSVCVAQLMVDTLEQMAPAPPPPRTELEGVEVPALER